MSCESSPAAYLMVSKVVQPECLLPATREWQQWDKQSAWPTQFRKLRCADMCLKGVLVHFSEDKVTNSTPGSKHLSSVSSKDPVLTLAFSYYPLDCHGLVRS